MPNLLFSKDSITYIIITGDFCFVFLCGRMIEYYDPQSDPQDPLTNPM